MPDELGDVGGTLHSLHSLLELWPLGLLVSIKYVWFLSGQPREHLVESRFGRSMPEHQDLVRVDALVTQQVVQVHLVPTIQVD